MNRPAWITNWFNYLIKVADFSVEDVSLSSSKEWVLVDGEIRHISGKFFQIVGVEWADSNGKKQNQPLMEQQEIGTLGFLMRSNNGKLEVLVQAKIEPGNVGIVQLAPTCQATDSNAAQIHGGEKPPFIGWFNTKKTTFVYDVLQSEQGTRFLGKRNRNVLRVINGDAQILPYHKWLSAKQLLKLLSVDFLVNTDARSVLVCSPWEKLVAHKPFTKSNSTFSKELAKSYASQDGLSDIGEMKAHLQQTRSSVKKPRTIKLEELNNWEFNRNKSDVLRNKKYTIRLIHTNAKGREVPQWEQPIVDSSSVGEIELVCGRSRGVLHFLFRPSFEPGLYNHVELGPSVVHEPGSKISKNSKPRGVVRIASKQSEEGGRFYKDINHYRIVDAGDVLKYTEPNQDYWLTLGQIRQLLNEEGWFTNEARSVLSLLLTWL